MDITQYLRRIGLEGPMAPTAENLRVLQKAHLYSVPYENLDILAGVPLDLDMHALYDKIVTRRRGGFCFELNELFGQLLRELGYDVTDCFGRFLRNEKTIPMRRHHVLIVTVPGSEERYLCDAGVGSGSPTYPVRMSTDTVLDDGENVYRFRTDGYLGWVLQERHDGGWRDVYSFTEEKQLTVDFVATMFYCEKSPDSIFNKAPMISLRMDGGRMTRDGDLFRVFRSGNVTEEKAVSAEERMRWMEERFGLKGYGKEE